MGAAWLNVGSAVLGLISWALPVLYLVKRKAGNWGVFSAASIGACAAALCMQLFYTDHLVKIRDWSALMDTSRAVARVCAALLVITLVLNAVSFVVHMGNGKGTKTFTL